MFYGLIFFVFGIFCFLMLEFIARIKYKNKKDSGKITLEFLLTGHQILPFLKKDQRDSQSSPARYSQHPFTGWSLNPDFINQHSEPIHNQQGFRSNYDLLHLNPDALKIYCAGESTTYCTNIEKNEQTWPFLLEKELKQTLGVDVQVINGGVGGYNSFQSFIRLSAFIDIISPDFILVYHHAKNDLTPFYNGDPSLNEVVPDFSNVIRGLNFVQMSKSINFIIKKTYLGRLWALTRLSFQQKNILWYTYDMQAIPEAPELLKKRFDINIVQNIHKNISGLCKGRGIPLMMATQIVRTKDFDPYLQIVNNSIKEISSKDKNCIICDLNKKFPKNPELFWDKLHFSVKGCRELASFLCDFMVNSQFLKPLITKKSGR